MYNLLLMNHCGLVAQAALMIAERTKEIDPSLAHRCGLFHDFGKYFLSETDKYKHPRLGYIMMLQNKEDQLAQVCLAHPFPILNAFEYVKAYCRGDTEEAEQIIKILPSIQTDIYIELIQYCDKISGKDRYVSLKEKFAWYQEKSPTVDPAIIQKNYQALSSIQEKLEDLMHQTIASIFHFSV